MDGFERIDYLPARGVVVQSDDNETNVWRADGDGNPTDELVKKIITPPYSTMRTKDIQHLREMGYFQ